MPENGCSKIINLILRGKMSMMGAALVSILLPVLVVSICFDALGLIDKPYFSFLLYVVMVPLLIVGMLLVLLGILFFPGKEDLGVFTVEYLKEQFARPGRYTRIRRHLYFTVSVTFLIVFIVGLASYSSFKYTNSARFCGQFCHNVMAPQYTAYKNSPHSRIPCVECHLGKDANWSERARFTGLKQLLSVVSNSYDKPILSPIESLRPGRSTCEQCHLPEKFHGSRLYTKKHYLQDEKNTLVTTVILMKVGSGDVRGEKAHGIHWHVSETRSLRYLTAEGERKRIVELRQTEKGKKDLIYIPIKDEKEGRQAGNSKDGETEEMRVMDCIDCHNRPTHVFRSAEEAVDQKMAADIIPSYLPYIKRQAVALLQQPYTSRDEARRRITSGLQNWYREHYSTLTQDNPDLIERAIEGTVAAYEENVFPEMKVTWGIYESNLGHKNDAGCFRCHGALQERESGKIISRDCTLCHLIMVEDTDRLDSATILKKVVDAQRRKNDNTKE